MVASQRRRCTDWIVIGEENRMLKNERIVHTGRRRFIKSSDRFCAIRVDSESQKVIVPENSQAHFLGEICSANRDKMCPSRLYYDRSWSLSSPVRDIVWEFIFKSPCKECS